MSAAEAKEMIRQFEEGSLPKEQWTHQAHFVMALWYCYHHPLPVAIQCIKKGIMKYNTSIGGKNTDEAGYHETITLFYIKLMVNYLLTETHTGIDFLVSALDTQYFIGKDFPLQYYSRELLMSKAARKNWMEPDKKPLCFS